MEVTRDYDVRFVVSDGASDVPAEGGAILYGAVRVVEPLDHGDPYYSSAVDLFFGADVPSLLGVHPLNAGLAPRDEEVGDGLAL